MASFNDQVAAKATDIFAQHFESQQTTTTAEKRPREEETSSADAGSPSQPKKAKKKNGSKMPSKKRTKTQKMRVMVLMGTTHCLRNHSIQRLHRTQ